MACYDLFRYDDGRLITEMWNGTTRAVPLIPPLAESERHALDNVTINDLRLAFRHPTEPARYVGTLCDASLGSDASPPDHPRHIFHAR